MANVGTLLSPGCGCYRCDAPPPPCGDCDLSQWHNSASRWKATLNYPRSTDCSNPSNYDPCCNWSVCAGGQHPDVTVLSLESGGTADCAGFTGVTGFNSFQWCASGTYEGGQPFFLRPSSREIKIHPFRVDPTQPTTDGFVNLIPASTTHVLILVNFADTLLGAGKTVFYQYDTGACECFDSITIPATDFFFGQRAAFGALPIATDPSITDCRSTWSNLVIENQTDDCGVSCAANCCDGLKAGTPNITSINKWSIGVAGGTACFPLAIPWVTTLSESPACTFQSTYAVGGGSCFTDGAGGNWFVLQMKLVVTSTNSAGPKPCTTCAFTITYERVSDGALADQIYNYDYDYCTYTTGALSLSSTSHTFPSGAPVFPSVTVTALA